MFHLTPKGWVTCPPTIQQPKYQAPLPQIRPATRDVAHELLALRNRWITLEPSVSRYAALELSLGQIVDRITLFLGQQTHLMGSAVGAHFCNGPPANDFDFEVSLPTQPSADTWYTIETSIWSCFNQLIQEACKKDQTLPRGALQVYGGNVKRIPDKKGWVANLGFEVQLIVKVAANCLYSLSSMDSLRVSFAPGKLWSILGKRIVTDDHELQQIIEQTKQRNLEQGIVDLPAQGRLLRLLHYWAHGTKLNQKDLSRGLDELTACSLDRFETEYLRHLRNHFPSRCGKLIDYLNFLTIVEDRPDWCRWLSAILWTYRAELGLGTAAEMARLIRLSPYLAPQLLRFIRGALLHESIIHNGQSPIKAWTLSFLQGEIRSFFQISGPKMDRFLSMCLPGEQRTPTQIAMEFLYAWQHLETELPKCGGSIGDLRGILKSLGIASPVADLGQRSKVIHDFATATDRPHMKSLLRSHKMISKELAVYVDRREEALERSIGNQCARQQLPALIGHLNENGQLIPLLQKCFDPAYPHLHKIGFQASRFPRPVLTPALNQKLGAALKNTCTKLPRASLSFQKSWIRSAEWVIEEPAIRGLYQRAILELPEPARLADPLMTLFHTCEHLDHAKPLKQILPHVKRMQRQSSAIRDLPIWRKQIFCDTLVGALHNHCQDGSRLENQLMSLVRHSHLFTHEEQECLHRLLHPKEDQKAPEAMTSSHLGFDESVATPSEEVVFMPVRRAERKKIPKPTHVETDFTTPFLEALEKHLVTEASEHYARAEKQLSGEALAQFKVEATKALKKEPSDLPIVAGGQQVVRFIAETTQLLPVYAKLLPSRGKQRIHSLLAQTSEAACDYPKQISRLLKTAQELNLFQGKQLSELYRLHKRAIEGFCRSEEENINPLIFHHLDEIQRLEPASEGQTAELFQLHFKVAMALLKQAMGRTDQVSSCDLQGFRHHFTAYFTPCLLQRAKVDNWLSIQYAHELLVAFCGVPVILSVLNILGDRTVGQAGLLRLNVMKALSKDVTTLKKSLETNTWLDKLFNALETDQSHQLLTHVVDFMKSFGRRQASAVTSIMRFRKMDQDMLTVFHLFDTLEKKRRSAALTVKETAEKSWNQSYEKLIEVFNWVSYCYSLSAGMLSEVMLSPFIKELSKIKDSQNKGQRLFGHLPDYKSSK